MSTKKRMIEIFLTLLENKKMTTKEIAEKYNVTQRTAQRDIKDVTEALDSLYQSNELTYDTKEHAYSLKQLHGLNQEEVYALSKILLASRALNKKETKEIIEHLTEPLPEKEQKQLKQSILNELTFMTTIHDQQDRKAKLRLLEQMIHENSWITFDYTPYEETETPETRFFTFRPTTVFFDHYYFYLVGIEKQSGDYQTLRIDWIKNIKNLAQKEKIAHRSRYEQGLKRPVTAYAYPGKKTRIQFEYYGFVDYVKDRFPSCTVLRKLEKENEYPFSVYLLQIEVEYSWGVKLWLLGEMGALHVTSPEFVVEDMKQTLHTAYKRYE